MPVRGQDEGGAEQADTAGGAAGGCGREGKTGWELCATGGCIQVCAVFKCVCVCIFVECVFMGVCPGSSARRFGECSELLPEE